jgi:hypothetical protein
MGGKEGRGTLGATCHLKLRSRVSGLTVRLPPLHSDAIIGSQAPQQRASRQGTE